ncbi:MAG: hypothetical protein HZC40_22005 [Chloroflexi bacterium]|nr:hypothetical protein [Chloroflexota bacterium]
MKAFEFETTLTADRAVNLPSELKTQLAPGSSIRVILLLRESNEDKGWTYLTSEQFLKGYSDSDKVYDDEF